jgi:hypothetical protein
VHNRSDARDLQKKENEMKSLTTTLLVAASALALATTTASADVACNDEGDCWHIKGHADYKPEFKLHVHPDSWKWGEKEHYRFHEHEGHGYWHSGVWIGL